MYCLALNVKNRCHFSFTTNDEMYQSIRNMACVGPSSPGQRRLLWRAPPGPSPPLEEQVWSFLLNHPFFSLSSKSFLSVKHPNKLLSLLAKKDISLDPVSFSSHSQSQKAVSLLTLFRFSPPLLSCLYSDLHLLLPTQTLLTKSMMLSSCHLHDLTAVLTQVVTLSS